MVEQSKVGPAPTRWFEPRTADVQVGDLLLLITTDQKRYLITVRAAGELHTHHGIFYHERIIGRHTGDTVESSLGHAALLLEPSLDDVIKHLKRGTQIIYPKDAAYLVHKLSLRAGSTVIEAGTGSAGLTTALAWAVAPTGIVYTYEARDDTYQLARNNLERVGLLPYVRMHLASIEDGFQQQNVDAVFLDVREPWQFLGQVRSALRPGGFFASLLPTTNQASALLAAMEAEGFADIAMEELLLRSYKTSPDRLRPEDSMNGHTGYLIFGRSLANLADSGRWLAKARQRYLARVQANEQLAVEEERRTTERAEGGLKYPKLPLP